jgi:hypothetical protein
MSGTHERSETMSEEVPFDKRKAAILYAMDFSITDEPGYENTAGCGFQSNCRKKGGNCNADD